MIAAARYANALMELAREKNKLDEVREDMKLLLRTCSESREFKLFVNSPVIKTDKKIAVFGQLFKGKVSDLTLQFLNLMTRKGREKYLNQIASEFEEHYKKDKNIFTAVVTSAKGLDKATRDRLLDMVRTQLKGEVELVEKTDPSTLGGFILKVGDKQVDRSVSRQLNNLKKDFINKN